MRTLKPGSGIFMGPKNAVSAEIWKFGLNREIYTLEFQFQFIKWNQLRIHMLLSSGGFPSIHIRFRSLGCLSSSSSSMLCNVCSCCKILLLILNFMHFLKYFNFPALKYFVHHTTEEKRGRSQKLCRSRGGRLIWKTKCWIWFLTDLRDVTDNFCTPPPLTNHFHIGPAPPASLY